MRTRTDETSVARGAPGESIHEIRPWREVGWIFRDGDIFAIERRGDRTRTRSALVSHLRDRLAAPHLCLAAALPREVVEPASGGAPEGARRAQAGWGWSAGSLVTTPSPSGSVRPGE